MDTVAQRWKTFVRKVVKEHPTPYRTIAQRGGFHQSYISMWLRPDTDAGCPPSKEIVKKFAFGARIDTSLALLAAGYAPLNNDVGKALNPEDSLTLELQHVIREIDASDPVTRKQAVAYLKGYMAALRGLTQA